MKKKIVSIILATAMSAALLTGCSGGSETGQTSASEASQAESAQPEGGIVRRLQKTRESRWILSQNLIRPWRFPWFSQLRSARIRKTVPRITIF